MSDGLTTKNIMPRKEDFERYFLKPAYAPKVQPQETGNPLGFDIQLSKKKESNNDDSERKKLHVNFDEGGNLSTHSNSGFDEGSIFPSLERRSICFYDIDWGKVINETTRNGYFGPRSREKMQSLMMKDDSGRYDLDELERREDWPLKNYLLNNNAIDQYGYPNVEGIIRILETNPTILDGETLAFALGDTNKLDVADYRKLQDKLLDKVVKSLLAGNVSSAFAYIECVFPNLGMEQFTLLGDKFPTVLQPKYLMKAPIYISHPSKNKEEVRKGFIEQGVDPDDENLDQLVEDMSSAKDSVIFWKRLMRLNSLPLKNGGSVKVRKNNNVEEKNKITPQANIIEPKPRKFGYDVD
ncbi:MAG: hypothetical protein HRT47_10905 [Candidatus Caenarcaniphilales bacterium]|nr:hypothetical protein [Candidatus Caenarcaniphilales bacterium]